MQHSALSTQHSALRGKRIVVTRAAEQAHDILAQLEALGAEVILFPTICTAAVEDSSALDRAIAQLSSYAWIIFTSRNGVRFFFERITQIQHRFPIPDSWPLIACVGRKTAAALAQVGHSAAFVPEKFVAEEIAAGLGEVKGQHILLPQATIARPTLAQQLEAARAQVDAIPIYETRLGQPSAAAHDALKAGVDLITFTSPSTFENFMKLADVAILRAAPLACIGPVTAEAVEAAGFCVDIVPADHTVEGLVDAIANFYQIKN